MDHTTSYLPTRNDHLNEHLQHPFHFLQSVFGDLSFFPSHTPTDRPPGSIAIHSGPPPQKAVADDISPLSKVGGLGETESRISKSSGHNGCFEYLRKPPGLWFIRTQHSSGRSVTHAPPHHALSYLSRKLFDISREGMGSTTIPLVLMYAIDNADIAPVLGLAIDVSCAGSNASQIPKPFAFAFTNTPTNTGMFRDA